MHNIDNQVKHIRDTILLATENEFPLHGACLIHAIFVKLMLGFPIVAGTMAWRYTTFDDGKNNNFFGYQFVESEFVEWNRTRKTNLPEIHIFNKKDDLILDLTTKYLPKQANDLVGYNWEHDLIPPDYYFGSSQGKNFVYKINPIATQFANELADAIIKEHGIKVCVNQ